MNNAKYGDIIINTLSPDFLIKDVQINFLNEMKLGDTAEIRTKKTDSGYLITGFQEQNTEKVYFRALVKVANM